MAERSASLSWNAPETRANGSDLSPYDLERYVIRYGTDRENLDKKIEIENVGGLQTMTYEIENLTVGNWYFSIQVEDVDGLVSAPSEVVSKTI
ncbi:MAG: fibronectin type III domain-containing protein [Marinobacter sp.]